MPLTLRDLSPEDIEDFRKQGVDVTTLPPNTPIYTKEEIEKEQAKRVATGGVAGAVGSTLKSHAGGIVGGGAGSLGGLAAASWLLGPEVGLPATLLSLGAAAVGGLGGSMLGQKAQEKLTPAQSYQAMQEKQHAYELVNPITTTATDIVAGALASGGKPNLTAPFTAAKGISKLAQSGLMSPVERQAVSNVILGNTINTGINAGLQLATTGEIHPKELASAAIGGAFFSDPSFLGKWAVPHWKPLTRVNGVTPRMLEEVTATGENLAAYEARRKVEQQQAQELHDRFDASMSAINQMHAEQAAQADAAAKRVQAFHSTDYSKLSNANVLKIFKSRFTSPIPKGTSDVDAAMIRQRNAELTTLPLEQMRKEIYEQDFAANDPAGFEQYQQQKVLQQQANAARLAELRKSVAEQNQAVAIKAEQERRLNDFLRAEQARRAELEAEAANQQRIRQQQEAEAWKQEKARLEAEQRGAITENQARIINPEAIRQGMTSHLVKGAPVEETVPSPVAKPSDAGGLSPEELAQQEIEQRLSGGKRELYQPADEERYPIGRYSEMTPEQHQRMLLEAGKMATDVAEVKGDIPFVTDKGERAAGVTFNPKDVGRRLIGIARNVATSDTGYHELVHTMLRDLDNSRVPRLTRLARQIREAYGGEEPTAQTGGIKYYQTVEKMADAGVLGKLGNYFKDVWSNIKIAAKKGDNEDLMRNLVALMRTRGGEDSILGQGEGEAKFQPAKLSIFSKKEQEERIPISGFKEPKLEMTPELQERLKESVVKTPMFHATKRDYERADPSLAAQGPGLSGAGMHFGTVQAANDRAAQMGLLNPNRIAPYYLDIRNPFRVSDLGANSPRKLAREMQLEGLMDIDEYNNDYNVLITAENGEQEQFRKLQEILQRNGYDGLVYKNETESPGSDSYVAFDKNQIINALAPKRDEGGTLYQQEGATKPTEAQPDKTVRKSSFFPFLTSRVDKIADKLKSPTANYVTDNLQKFADYADLKVGRIGNKLISTIRDVVPDSIERIYHYLHDIDNIGQSSIRLRPWEKTIADKITEILREPRREQIAEGLQVKQGGTYRQAGIKPEGYMFNIIDRKVVDTWASKPDSPEAKKYDKLYIDHQMAKGESAESAAKMLREYKDALGSVNSQDAEFAALRRAEGNGLPWELVDQNFASAAMRYAKRAARDLAYFKYIQNDPKMRKALNLRDQFGNWPDPSEHPEIELISPNDEVKKAMRSVYGIDLPQNEGLMSAARLTGNAVMGVGTSSRNILNMPAFLAQYVQLKQLPLLAKAISNFNESKARAFQNNAVKANFHDFDAAGYYEGNPNPVIRLMDKFSTFLRKWQGRDFSDKFEGEFYYSLGEVLAPDNIARAKMGDKEALHFVRRFGNIVEGGADSLLKRAVTNEDIQRMAKRFVDGARGTYNETGLPSWALEGEIAPFTALSRFAIEKSNTIWKDVIQPARQGIYGPLLRYALGSLGVGALVEQLNELLSNKRGPDATINETLAAGDKEDLVAKAVGLLQLASFAGIVGDGAKAAMQAIQGKALRYNQPLSFPLYTLVTDTLAGNVSDAAAAIREGDDPFEVLGQLATTIANQSVQTMRYVDANFVNPEKAKRKEMFRDYNVFQQLEATRDSEAPSRANEFKNRAIKDYKREKDLPTALKELPALLREAYDNAGGDYEKLRRNLTKLKNNSYQTMPSIESMPISFLRYLRYLEQTQGQEAAQERVKDYFQQKMVNQVKADLIP